MVRQRRGAGRVAESGTSVHTPAHASRGAAVGSNQPAPSHAAAASLSCHAVRLLGTAGPGMVASLQSPQIKQSGHDTDSAAQAALFGR